jgi:thiol-disulfide isomerase/thioredoxin
MNRQAALIAGVAVLALAAGFGAAIWHRQPGEPQSGAAQALLAAPLNDLQNQTRTLNQYRGKVLVVNFWATWCPPCREEIPHFIEIQRQPNWKNVQFVGIALDNPSDVAGFVQEFAVNYPVLIGGVNESEMMRVLGNTSGGLPYTLIYDRDGNLREKIIGGLDKSRLERLLAPLI